MSDLTPRQIVAELDRYIVGQDRAKRMVAIAVRNRVRRRKLDPELREEISPKNIILIGPTGVGKTEIARRLARLVNAPFVKVEATKYTEVGYVGRDVESMVRDLVEKGIAMVRTEMSEEVMDRARQRANDRILDILLPPPPGVSRRTRTVEGRTETTYEASDDESDGAIDRVAPTAEERWLRSRDKMRTRLIEGRLEDREIEIDVKRQTEVQLVGNVPGMGPDDMSNDLKNVFEKMFPPKIRTVRMPVAEAREILVGEELDQLLDMEKIVREALERVQDSGIIFLDEIDKIAGRQAVHGPDVSREGVQRDILPIVEGSVINTKYGPVRANHILFVAAGAFHMSKPSDLIPELQGRFPLRAELGSLSVDDFKRILTEPEAALTKQYEALLATEEVSIRFTEDGIDEMAQSAFRANEQSENIGARRLHTVMEKVLEDVSFDSGDMGPREVVVDAAYVRERLADILKDQDLSRFVL
jgi:ATP-dependent HslUV protease ATP-binding subunit HslU